MTYLGTLFGKYAELKALRYMLEHPLEELHGNELSRRLSLSPATVQKMLKAAEADGLLTSRRVANIVLYRLNTEHPLVPKMQEVVQAL